MHYGFRNVYERGYVILEDGRTMFPTDVMEKLVRLNQLEKKPPLCDGWRDVQKETPINGEPCLIWIYGEAEEPNKGYILDGCFVDSVYYSAGGDAINAVAWMKRPNPPAFA